MKQWLALIGCLLVSAGCAANTVTVITPTINPLPFGVMVIVTSTAAPPSRTPENDLPDASASPATDAIRTTATPRTSDSDCPPPDGWEPYTVRSGDFLSVIARRFGVTMGELIEANCLRNPDTILVGQELFVPSPPATETPRPDAPTATRESRG